MARKVLFAGETGDTGRASFEAAIEIGLDTRARVRKKGRSPELLSFRTF
jgi:hypothetical protein